MKIKDQIRSRREALGISLGEMARRVGVTEQAVRHWESGRSFPGKSKARLVEQALNMELDWTEGVSYTGERKNAAAMIDPGDIDLLLTIARLPLDAKRAISDLAKLHLAAVDAARGATPDGPPDDPPEEAPPTALRRRPAKA